MKLSKKIKFSALAALAAVACQLSIAKDTPNRALTLDNIGSGLAEEQRKAAEALARTISDSARGAGDTLVGKRVAETAQTMARRADDIANASLATDRDKVLRFLGLDPVGESAIYYFVSYEMPLEVLRSYVIEAMWTGGTLIFRGVPKGRELKDFITTDLRALVYGKGSSAAISIDPRLFDAYKIAIVPSIVYTEERKNFLCVGVSPKAFEYDDKTYHYDTCPPVDEAKYWKITGAVTSDFALREFINAGAAKAAPYLEALAKGFATGTVAPKNQPPFAGEWKDAISPEELMAVRDAVEVARNIGSGIPPASDKPSTLQK